MLVISQDSKRVVFFDGCNLGLLDESDAGFLHLFHKFFSNCLIERIQHSFSSNDNRYLATQRVKDSSELYRDVA